MQHTVVFRVFEGGDTKKQVWWVRVSKVGRCVFSLFGYEWMKSTKVVFVGAGGALRVMRPVGQGCM